MTKKKDRIITFILILIIVILINAIINQFNPSLDLTRDKVYSLSKESKTLIKNIREPMSVKFFVTPNLPTPFSTYEKYVKDTFEGYKSKNISFEIIDASKNQSLASQYGIDSRRISVLERDQTQTKIAYMGIAFLYGDSIETIPFIQDTEGLEYNIDTAIKKLLDKNDKLRRLENNLNVYYIASPEIYEILPLGAATSIPDSIMQAVSEANKNLMNKVIFNNIDMSNPSNEYNEEILKRLNIKKLEWEDIEDESGNVIVNKGSAYFSLILENGNDIKELSTTAILYGDFSAVKDDILKNIDGLLGIKANIGYITGHGEPDFVDIPQEFGGNPNDKFSSFTEYLNEIDQAHNFEVIDTRTENIPSIIDALIVAGSKYTFEESELYKIDQFIMSGKPVLFMLNGFEINEGGLNYPVYDAEPRLIPIDSGLNSILQNYGLYIATNMIFDENSYRNRDPQSRIEQILYYVPMITTENINPQNDITKSINLILSPMTSEVLINTNIDGVKITPLLHTSDKSWIETENISSSMNDGAPSDSSRLSKRLVAAISEGRMESAFLGKDVTITNTNNNSQLNIANINRINSTSDGKIIVIGSYDMGKNSAYQANKIFLMNLIDYMAGDGGLMSIRRKGAIFNPPYQIPESLKLFVRAINIVIVPLTVIIFGLALWNSDKKRRKKIFEKFNNAEKE